MRRKFTQTMCSFGFFKIIIPAVLPQSIIPLHKAGSLSPNSQIVCAKSSSWLSNYYSSNRSSWYCAHSCQSTKLVPSPWAWEAPIFSGLLDLVEDTVLTLPNTFCPLRSSQEPWPSLELAQLLPLVPQMLIGLSYSGWCHPFYNGKVISTVHALNADN